MKWGREEGLGFVWENGVSCPRTNEHRGGLFLLVSVLVAGAAKKSYLIRELCRGGEPVSALFPGNGFHPLGNTCALYKYKFRVELTADLPKFHHGVGSAHMRYE